MFLSLRVTAEFKTKLRLSANARWLPKWLRGKEFGTRTIAMHTVDDVIHVTDDFRAWRIRVDSQRSFVVKARKTSEAVRVLVDVDDLGHGYGVRVFETSIPLAQVRAGNETRKTFKFPSGAFVVITVNTKEVDETP